MAAASAATGCGGEQGAGQGRAASRQGENTGQSETAAQGAEAPAQEGGLTRAEQGQAVYGENSYISPLTEIFGEVLVGQGVFVASNTVLRAAPE